MYVNEAYRVNNNQLDDMLRNANDNEITPETLVMIDYVYHGNDPDYDGVISFFDRLYHKLRPYTQIEWDLDGIKANIRTSHDPPAEYLRVLHDLLANRELIMMYGI